MFSRLAAVVLFAPSFVLTLLQSRAKKVKIIADHTSADANDAIITNSNSTSVVRAVTFREYYYGHASGRGMWKWSCALDAYQRHLAPFAGRQLALAEVGVQSGGSLNMWKAILGSTCHVYGFDIDPACAKFADASTTITIGDQGNLDMWNKFFANTVSQLDAFIDDGSHQPHHMGTSVQVSIPHLKPGGLVSIEDTNGQHSVQSFYCPYAAKSIGSYSAQGLVASVHVYPLMLLVHKAGGDIVPSIPAPALTVDNFPALWAALPQHKGGAIAFENPSWGSFFSETILCQIFTTFIDLHGWAANFNPPNCHGTHDGACRVFLANTPVQNSITGVHIFPTRFLVEVAEKPPVLEAVRMGTEWVPWYGSHR